MKINFKKANNPQLYEITGENLTLIKVAIVIHYGTDNAYHVFQKVVDNNLLLYLPEMSDRDNLVKRSYKKYVSEYSGEIKKCIESIKEI